jgi:hypothetical protein
MSDGLETFSGNGQPDPQSHSFPHALHEFRLARGKKSLETMKSSEMNMKAKKIAGFSDQCHLKTVN